MKKIKLLSIILCVVMLACLALASCDGGTAPCEKHKDSDKDGICDTCQTEIPPCDHVDLNKDYVCDTCREKLEIPKVSYQFTIKDENGAGVKDATISLKDSEDEIVADLVTDKDGVATGQVVEGRYVVIIEGLPEYWYCNESYSTITISEDEKDFSYVAINNAPDGTERKPYPAENAETGEATALTFPANQTYNFITKSIVKRYLVINNEYARVIYKGTEYNAESGVVKVLIEATSSNSATNFQVVNLLDSENEIALSFESVPGTADNPIEISYHYVNKISLIKGETIYYKVIATQTGYVIVHCPDELNNISVSNLTTYESANASVGGKAIYIKANAGDEISICVELLPSAQESTPIELSVMVEERLGEEFNRVVLYETETFTLEAGQTIYFATGNPVNLEIDSDGSFLLDGEEKTTLEGVDNFFVTNQGDEAIEVTLEIEFVE
ncbi:MAG: carboxypeptidase regulatory-like domain-containing protein [Clostridia bacterium]|nr:carboxypeptidase regulatory-like domain-containing protein [Clostridia bacterium]